MTVNRDVKAAPVEGATPDRVEGKDGKATRPDAGGDASRSRLSGRGSSSSLRRSAPSMICSSSRTRSGRRSPPRSSTSGSRSSAGSRAGPQRLPIALSPRTAMRRARGRSPRSTSSCAGTARSSRRRSSNRARCPMRTREGGAAREGPVGESGRRSERTSYPGRVRDPRLSDLTTSHDLWMSRSTSGCSRPSSPSSKPRRTGR